MQEDAISYRIDSGDPKKMTLTKGSFVSKRPKDSIRKQWGRIKLEDVCNVSTIEIYIDGTKPMAAYRTYRLTITLQGFDPIVLGMLDCTQKSLKGPIPEFFNQCEDGTTAIVDVYEVKPSLVYETAGKELEEFLEAMKDQWRAQIMSLVRQGMKEKKLKENQKISPLHFKKAVHFLHDQCQSKQLDGQFEEAFKSLKL